MAKNDTNSIFLTVTALNVMRAEIMKMLSFYGSYPTNPRAATQEHVKVYNDLIKYLRNKITSEHFKALTDKANEGVQPGRVVNSQHLAKLLVCLCFGYAYVSTEIDELSLKAREAGKLSSTMRRLKTTRKSHTGK